MTKCHFEKCSTQYSFAKSASWENVSFFVSWFAYAFYHYGECFKMTAKRVFYFFACLRKMVLNYFYPNNETNKIIENIYFKFQQLISSKMGLGGFNINTTTTVKPTEDTKPTAYLFADNVVGCEKIGVAHKYVMISVFHPIINPYSFSLEELNKEIEKIDFLTFDWKSLPKEVFVDIMSAFSLARIAFFCGYFQVHIKFLRKDKKKEIILDLWDKLSK